MIDAVQKAVKDGLSFICATCQNYWWGVENKLDHCRAVNDGQACCGPLGGMVYPYYHGPLTRPLTGVCFVCGDIPDAAVDVCGKGMVGVCKKHLDVVRNYSRPGEKPRFVTEQYLPVIDG